MFTIKTANLPKCLTINPYLVRKKCPGSIKIANFPQFLTIDPYFVQKCKRVCTRPFMIARGHRPRLNRREISRGNRERERERGEEKIEKGEGDREEERERGRERREQREEKRKDVTS